MPIVRAARSMARRCDFLIGSGTVGGPANRPRSMTQARLADILGKDYVSTLAGLFGLLAGSWRFGRYFRRGLSGLGEGEMPRICQLDEV